MIGRGEPGGRAEVVARLLSVGVCVLLAVVLVRIGQLKMAPSDELGSYISMRTTGKPLEAARGELLDRRGRLLATTRYGYRVIIDPETLPQSPDEVIVALSETLGEPAGEIGSRIMGALIENELRRESADGAGGAPAQRSLAETLRRALGLAEPEDAIAGGPDAEDRADTPTKPLIRYLPVGPELTLAQGERVRDLGLPGVWLERRPVREYAGEGTAAPIVGKVGLADRTLDQTGLLGAELTLDERLRERDGQAGWVRDAWGRPLWIERGAWTGPQAGGAVRLSIDLELQRIATEELRRGVEEADAAGGRLIMLDPSTGEVLAMVDLLREIPSAQPFPWLVKDEESGEWTAPLGELAPDPRDRPRFAVERPDPGREIHPALGRNRCVEDLYEPGSTFKPFVWSLALEKGLLPDDEIIDNEANYYVTQCGRSVEDVTHRTSLTWNDVLKFSSNVGMAKLSERLSFDELHDGVRRYGFGSRTGISLPGESPGLVTPAKRWSSYSQTYVAIGHEVGVTPIQMVRSFSCFARDGAQAGTLPRVTLVADDAGEVGLLERVLPEQVALRARHAMVGVAERLDSRLERETKAPASYSMFGKSGTAQIPCVPPPGMKRPKGATGYFPNQYNSSFIAGAPLASPEIVVLCVIDDPGPIRIRIRQHYGSYVAGPVVRRVIERSLSYMGVPPDLSQDDAPVAAIAD